MRTALAALLIALAGAQSRPPAPKTVRLYVFDCGTLNIADPMPLFGLKKEEVGNPNLSDAAYLIVHPRGTLIWDTGFLSDSVIESGAPQTGLGARVENPERPARAGGLSAGRHHLSRLVALPRRSHGKRQRLPRVDVARLERGTRRHVRRAAAAHRRTRHLQRPQEQQDRVCQRRLRCLRRRHRHDQTDAGPHAGSPGSRRQAGENRSGDADRRHVSLPGRSGARQLSRPASSTARNRLPHARPSENSCARRAHSCGSATTSSASRS